MRKLSEFNYVGEIPLNEEIEMDLKPTLMNVAFDEPAIIHAIREFCKNHGGQLLMVRRNWGGYDINTTIMKLCIPEENIPKKEEKAVADQIIDGFLEGKKNAAESYQSALKAGAIKPKTMDFSQALIELKAGKKVQRSGWNGKGMWLKIVNMQEMSASEDCPEVAWTDKYINLPTITMKTADDKLLFGWLASQTDMFANDWQIVE